MEKPLPDAALETPKPLDLSDEDVLTAMKEIGGHIDITAGNCSMARFRFASGRSPCPRTTIP